MKARLLEAAGGKPGHAGRPGHVLFSGPSPRTKAEGAAGAGTPVSGALGAALLAAALLLAPGEARALIECGTSGSNTLTCSGATYNDGIYYPDSAKLAGTNPTVNVPGRSAGSTTITAGSSQAVGIHVESQATHGFTVNVGGSTGGTAHVVNIVQGTNSVSGANRNNGVYLRQQSNNRRTTLDVRSGVTIGSSTTPMKQNGIYVDLRPTAASLGVGATAGTITSAATIYAARQGIRVGRTVGGTNDATTVTNTGAIFSGVNNAGATGTYVDRPHGIHVLHGGTQMTGSLTVTNSGDITVGGAYTGILMNYWGAGALSLDNSGDITAATGQTANQGIQFNYKYWDNQSAQTITLTNSGAITAADFGIRLAKVSGGAVELTNSGAVTATADAAQHTGHAIHLAEGVTFGSGRTYAANSGAVTVDNSGVLNSKNHALYVYLATADDDVELENSGAVTSEDGDGIRIERAVEGDVAVENSANVSGKWHGVYVGKAARVDFDQTGGTISGRTGVTLQVTRESAMGDTRSADGDGNHIPAIDVAWTGGNVARGTAADDAGRFPAASLWSEVFAADRESAAEKAMEGTLHYGGPAGIEAHALSWRDVVPQVAKGDDPGAFANAAAQRTAVPTGATAADNVYVAQLRAALENEEISVASVILTDIDSTATSVDDLSDAEIVSYLQTDAAAIRTVLRNVLAQGLSDGEKAILRAVATNDGVDAALTAAGFSDDTSDPNDYWSLVKALLDRHNLDDIRVSMTAGSIDSRGDGIRAYYATQNANNGGISVTVAEGVTVTGAKAGVYVANAGEGLRIRKRYAPKAIRELAGNAAAGEDDLIAIGSLNAAGDAIETPYLNQLVEVAGTVTGGTDAAVHLNGGGAVIVMAGGKVHAGDLGVAILVNDPGPAHLFIDGEVKGGEGGAAAVHLTGGGSVIVGLNGRVQADGADNAIQGGGDEETGVDLVAATAGMIVHREDAEEAANARVEGRLKDVGNIRFREHRNGVFTGYGSTLPVGDDGMLDASTLEWGPCPEGQTRGDDGECRTPPPPPPPPPGDGDDGAGDGPGTDPDVNIPRVTMPGVYVLRDDGTFDRQETPNDGISITVPKGVSVTARTGISVENARTGLMLARKYTRRFGVGIAPGEDPGDPDDLVAVTHGEGADKVPLRNQLVIVAGTVIGGTDAAAVHLDGGGAVIVEEGGRVHAGASGVGILVNDPGPALVYVDGEVKGAAGGAAAVHLTGGGSVIIGLNGKVEANGAEHAIRGGGDAAPLVALTVVTDGMIEYREDAEAAYARRVEGSLADVDEVRFRQDRDDKPTGYSWKLPVDDKGMLDTSELPSSTFSCEEAGDRRCRLYEALPSVLLAMNGLPSYAERMSAARDGNGGWARVEAARGEWQAKKATMETPATPLAYDHRRNAVRAGVDFHAGESGRVGVSVHALGGKAEMGGVGEVELDGMGGGLSATWRVGDFYVDAQAAVTLYDVDVESYTHGKMSKKDVYGAGYGLGVDVGRRMSVGGMFVTPRVGVEWSKVELDEFVDMERADSPEARARVSVEEADSVKGRVGVMVEAEMGSGETSGRLFASLDVEQEFSEETEVKVGEDLLKAEVRPTAVRLGLGGAFAVAEDVVVRGTAGFRTSGSGTSGYGGGLELQVRF